MPSSIAKSIKFMSVSLAVACLTLSHVTDVKALREQTADSIVSLSISVMFESIFFSSFLFEGPKHNSATAIYYK